MWKEGKEGGRERGKRVSKSHRIIGLEGKL